MTSKQGKSEMQPSGEKLIKDSLIASTIRRSQRNLSGAVVHRKTIDRMSAEGRPERELYKAGLKEGRSGPASNLADVLYNVYRSGLGRAIVVEESNRHVLLKVDNCLCRGDSGSSCCSFIAGYLAGALMKTGRYRALEVHRNDIGECSETGCHFLANLNLNI